MISHDNVDLVFDEPLDDPRFAGHEKAIREGAKVMAKAILNNTAQGPAQQSALRYVQVAMLLSISTLGGNG